MMNPAVFTLCNSHRKACTYIILIIFFFLKAVPVLACRYTVREIGFSDLAFPPYHLYIYHHAKITNNQNDRLLGLCSTGSTESNMETEPVNYEKQPVPLFLRSQKPLDSLFAVLVSPDSSFKPLVFAGNNYSLTKFTTFMLQSALSSPARKIILKNIPYSHAMVLLFAGADREQTDIAREVIRRAVEQIDPVLPLMPKPAEKPPRLIEIPVSQRNAEKVLLWSLGLPENFDDPYAVILYGRGRQIGPVLRGIRITGEAIYNILLLVGADCECEMDRSYLLGPMIPLSWPETVRLQIARTLGFDPENPAVKMDMCRIAKIDLAKERTGVLPPLQERKGKQNNERANKKSLQDNKQSVQKENNDFKSRALDSVYYVLFILGLFVIMGVVFILFLKKRRSSS
jgi:hypothetical protein